MADRRRPTWAGWVAVVLVAVGLGFLAGRAVFLPPAVAPQAVPVQTYTVAEGSVGRSSTYVARATWATTRLGTGAADGTVTSVEVSPGQEVTQGSVLYSVDLRPVHAAIGAVPAFRDLAPGVQGQDVAQLQQLLRDRGYPVPGPDGVFGPSTGRAVRAWQQQQGLEPTGLVPAADLVFVPKLPARVILADEVVVGGRLGGGTDTVRALAVTPEFTMEAGSNSAPPPVGAGVELARAGGQDGGLWSAVVASVVSQPDGSSTITLLGPDGGAPCAAECAAVPLAPEEAFYDAVVDIVPRTNGPSIPVSALGTDPDLTTFVLETDGTRRTVEVLASDGSRAIVSGLSVGDTVRLFAVGSAGDGDTEAPASVVGPNG